MSGSSLPSKVASYTSVLPPGPLHIVALVITVGVTWIVVSILLGGLGSGFPWVQQLLPVSVGLSLTLLGGLLAAGNRTCGLRLRTGLAAVWFVCFPLAGHRELSSLVCLLVSGTA